MNNTAPAWLVVFENGAPSETGTPVNTTAVAWLVLLEVAVNSTDTTAFRLAADWVAAWGDSSPGAVHVKVASDDETADGVSAGATVNTAEAAEMLPADAVKLGVIVTSTVAWATLAAVIAPSGCFAETMTVAAAWLTALGLR
jgi:hypothetical protein